MLPYYDNLFCPLYLCRENRARCAQFAFYKIQVLRQVRLSFGVKCIHYVYQSVPCSHIPRRDELLNQKTIILSASRVGYSWLTYQ